MPSTSPLGPVSSWKNTTDRGIVHAEAARKAFELTVHPAQELEPWVEHLWELRWSLPPGQAHTQRVLSFPNMHLVWEREGDEPVKVVFYGVPRGPYQRTLTGHGRVIGVRFRPGGWAGFVPGLATDWTGREVRAREFWPEIDGVPAEAGTIRSALGARALLPDPEAVEADRLVSLIRDTPGLLRVEDVAAAGGRTVRSLQRLFARWVGVSPKWVIGRFRLQEAASLLEAQPGTDLGALAHRLGYYDQAHFVKDFKAVLGVPPGRY